MALQAIKSHLTNASEWITEFALCSISNPFAIIMICECQPKYFSQSTYLPTNPVASKEMACSSCLHAHIFHKSLKNLPKYKADHVIDLFKMLKWLPRALKVEIK